MQLGEIVSQARTMTLAAWRKGCGACEANSGVSERHLSANVTAKDQRSMRVSFSDFMSRAYVKTSNSRGWCATRVRTFSVTISIEGERTRERTSRFLFSFSRGRKRILPREARAREKRKKKSADRGKKRGRTRVEIKLSYYWAGGSWDAGSA